MATTRTAAGTTGPIDEALDALVTQDPDEPGRHNARLVETGAHVRAVLGTWRRTKGDVAETAKEWHVSETSVQAAVRYYEQHRALFDAYFLVQEEESNA